jgi:hypothetical protein
MNLVDVKQSGTDKYVIIPSITQLHAMNCTSDTKPTKTQHRRNIVGKDKNK